MAEKIFHIIGRVIDQSGQGVEGLRVEAWDKDLIFNDLVGSAETDAEGRFEIQFKESYFKEIFIDRKPDLFFKVFQNDELIKSTEDSVLWNVKVGEKEIEIKVDIPTKSQVFKVKGTILQPDGTPVAGATVKAFDKNIRKETLLGEATTDKAGRYEITYRAEKFLQANKKRPDPIVRAFDQEGQEIAVSEIIYNAKQVETVDLVVGGAQYRGPSEYQQRIKTLTPLLKELELSGLTDEDIDFLSGKTGIDPGQITHLVLAARYAKKTDLPQEIFYGLFRQNLPTSLPALLAQNPDIQKSSLEAAVRDNIVP
jgi:5-hydroxyisourate hydrolase-like protein (transthyretin family)